MTSRNSIRIEEYTGESARKFISNFNISDKPVNKWLKESGDKLTFILLTNGVYRSFVLCNRLNDEELVDIIRPELRLTPYYNINYIYTFPNSRRQGNAANLLIHVMRIYNAVVINAEPESLWRRARMKKVDNYYMSAKKIEQRINRRANR